MRKVFFLTSIVILVLTLGGTATSALAVTNGNPVYSDDLTSPHPYPSGYKPRASGYKPYPSGYPPRPSGYTPTTSPKPKWVDVRSHTGKTWKAPQNPVTGSVEWSDLGKKVENMAPPEYQIYYKECTATEWQNAVVAPGGARRLLLQYLKPGVEYCYKVTVTINGKTYTKEGRVSRPANWQPKPTGTPSPSPVGTRLNIHKEENEPVLGQSDMTGKNPSNKNPTDMMGGPIVATIAPVCLPNGKATVSWTPSQTTVNSYHIVYGHGAGQHALRDLNSRAQRVDIGYLNTCVRYDFEVLAVGTDGRVTHLTPHVVMHN